METKIGVGYLTILFLLTPAFYAFSHDAVSAFAGEIYGTVYFESRVNIIGTVIVTKNATLKIKPGSALVFLNPQAELIVYGTIQALGDKGEPVYFESPLPDSSWRGIRLVNTSKRNIFKYCRFRRAKLALEVDNSSALIWRCRFQKNERTLRLRGETGKVTVKENSFIDNKLNWPLFENVSYNEYRFENNYWSGENYVGKWGGKFKPARHDMTGWTAE